MIDPECPYCGADIDINHDDGYGYGEDEKYQQECHKCDKTFVFETAVYFSYTLSEAACLNGGEHNYVETKTWPKEYTKLVCTMCDKEKALSPERLAEIIADAPA